MSSDTRRQKIDTAIESVIRPALQQDGGDIELLSAEENGPVKVRLRGACAHCPMAMMTIKGFVEKQLREATGEETLEVNAESF